MRHVNRRDFLKTSLGTAAVVAGWPQRPSRAAGEKVTIGVMGLGGRGRALAQMFAGRADVQIAYLCDADSRRFEPAKRAIEQAQGKAPQTVQDFRRILDDRSVDVLINATPDHWHALGTILACQAGKDVYVEKPLAHNIWEGRKMIEAARKYRRVVQVGTQTRSAPYVQAAIEQVRSGKLGDVHVIRVFNMMEHSPRPAGSVQPVPDGVGFTAVYSRRDGIVDWRACVDPVADQVEVTASHVGMAVDPATIEAVLAALLTQQPAARSDLVGESHAS